MKDRQPKMIELAELRSGEFGDTATTVKAGAMSKKLTVTGRGCTETKQPDTVQSVPKQIK